MIFDKAAGIVERYIPALLQRFKAARLFMFPGRAHEVLPHEMDSETCEYLSELFGLPFKTVAIEDTATCTLLWDMEPNQQGLGGVRGFVETQPFDANHILECADGQDLDPVTARAWCSRYPAGSHMISEGLIGPITLKGDKLLVRGEVKWFALATKDGGILALDTPSDTKASEARALTNAVLKNVDQSLQELFYFNTPNRFIVEEFPLYITKKRKRRTKAQDRKVERSPDRPKYTLLMPKQIRARLGLSEPGDGGPKRPHERRRHLRTFHHERFTKMKGKTIVIPATWIGPHEAVIGRKRYRILLDR
ncbi:hypothetical protein LCGC14_1611730 [marine sediment metagenome]|uniref:Uncharacterized protein n=1 Tax=marine sediment metagenome TaxID=412755 RepID=A0A0F9I825_9ZZZZ